MKFRKRGLIVITKYQSAAPIGSIVKIVKLMHTDTIVYKYNSFEGYYTNPRCCRLATEDEKKFRRKLLRRAGYNDIDYNINNMKHET